MYRLRVGTGGAHRDVQREVILEPPDHPDEHRIGPVTVAGALRDQFHHRTDGPFVRTFEDESQDALPVVLTIEKGTRVDVRSGPCRPVRQDTDTACARTRRTVDLREQHPAFAGDTRIQ